MTDTPDCFTPLYPTMWDLFEQDFLLALASKLEPADLSELERGYAMLAALANFYVAQYDEALERLYDEQAGALDDKDAEVQAMQLEIDALRKRVEELKRIASAS